MVKKSYCGRLLAAALSLMLAVSTAACGGNEKQEVSGQEEAFVYMPEVKTLQREEGERLSNPAIVNDRLYFAAESDGRKSFRYLDLTGPDSSPVEAWKEAGEEERKGYALCLFACEDGSIVSVYSMEDTFYLVKQAADGTEDFAVDVTQYLEDAVTLPYGLAGGDGNLYISDGTSHIWIFDQNGQFLSDISLETVTGGKNYIGPLGLSEEGNPAFLFLAERGASLAVYDRDKKQFAVLREGLPFASYDTAPVAGPEGGVLLNDGTALSEYDPQTDEFVKLVEWADYAIDGSTVRLVSILADGTLAVYCEDGDITGESSLVILRKAEAAESIETETITLGCLQMDKSLQSLIVQFNKTNGRYKVEVKEYAAEIDWSVDYDSEAARDVWQQAMQRLNSDILTENAPDMFWADDVNLKLLAQKGVIEDLNPYLEKSTVVNRSDLFASVLQACTVDGILCTIPTNFIFNTLLGRTSEVGAESGWTLDEMIAYAERYPDADIIAYITREQLLDFCLGNDMDSYVDWEAGTCAFDSPRFKKLLEFAARYGEEPTVYGSGDALASHEALLVIEPMTEPLDYQKAVKHFGEPVTAIGFPTQQGNGVTISVMDGICINSASQNKEAAWAFIEYTLSQEGLKNSIGTGFPIRLDAYDAMLEKAMTPVYVENENGDLVEMPRYSIGFGEGMIDIYAMTEEEAESLMEILDRIDRFGEYDDQLLAIVREEAGAFFSGQKSVDEVADIIQKRVQVYVDESR